MTFRALLQQQIRFVEDLLSKDCDPLPLSSPVAGYRFSLEDCIPHWRCGPFFDWHIFDTENTCWQGCHDIVVGERGPWSWSETVSGMEVGVEEPDTEENVVVMSPWVEDPWEEGWSSGCPLPPSSPPREAVVLGFWVANGGCIGWVPYEESSMMTIWWYHCCHCSVCASSPPHHPGLAWPASWWSWW